MGGRQRFKYVYVPADLSENLREMELTIPPGKDVECLLDSLKEHFARSGRSDAQREAQKQMLLKQMGDNAANVNTAMLEAAANLDMVENISLLANHKDVHHVGVNMYCDDQAQIKELPHNPRASAIAEACGKLIQVRGDAFIARIFDNEDHFMRMDFELTEMNSSADWVKQARLQAQRREQAPSSQTLMENLQQRSGGSKGTQPTVTVKELSEAEVAKESGNAAVKKGDWTTAVTHYQKAISLEATLLPARNNLALALLKLGQWKDAKAACEEVLAKEPNNVKALLRKAAACEGAEELGGVQGAVEVYKEVLRVERGNKEAAAALDRLQPPPAPSTSDATGTAVGDTLIAGNGEGVGAVGVVVDAVAPSLMAAAAGV